MSVKIREVQKQDHAEEKRKKTDRYKIMTEQKNINKGLILVSVWCVLRSGLVPLAGSALWCILCYGHLPGGPSTDPPPPPLRCPIGLSGCCRRGSHFEVLPELWSNPTVHTQLENTHNPFRIHTENTHKTHLEHTWNPVRAHTEHRTHTEHTE